MARISSFVALCFALIGSSRAAALGSAEDYAYGAVQAQIMALKTVYFHTQQLIMFGLTSL
jgi:hypothetical protein